MQLSIQIAGLPILPMMQMIEAEGVGDKMPVVLPCKRTGEMKEYANQDEWYQDNYPSAPYEPPKKMTWPEAREKLRRELGIQKL